MVESWDILVTASWKRRRRGAQLYRLTDFGVPP
jgi:hypothetical protein